MIAQIAVGDFGLKLGNADGDLAHRAAIEVQDRLRIRSSDGVI
jgi:hypothetical protein